MIGLNIDCEISLTESVENTKIWPSRRSVFETCETSKTNVGSLHDSRLTSSNVLNFGTLNSENYVTQIYSKLNP